MGCGQFQVVACARLAKPVTVIMPRSKAPIADFDTVYLPSFEPLHIAAHGLVCAASSRTPPLAKFKFTGDGATTVATDNTWTGRTSWRPFEISSRRFDMRLYAPIERPRFA
jgi:hypothetical protein